MSTTQIDYNALSDDTFRNEVRTFFEAEYPDELRYILRRARWGEMKEWWGRLHKQGWMAPTWPREWGGMALNATKNLIFIEEMERHGVARDNPSVAATDQRRTVRRHGER